MKEKKAFSVLYEYEVIYTEKLFTQNRACLFDLIRRDRKENAGPARLAFVIDQGLHRCRPELPAEIEGAFKGVFEFQLAGDPFFVPGGEKAKNEIDHFFDVLKRIEGEKLDRHAYLIALGGGAVLDMVGFAAAVAHRGIRHIRIPTTVLSQNDSGIGVKNGINFFGKKNFLGTFAPPVGVINDRDFLKTLSERDWRSGLPEAIKVSLLKDPDFFHWISAHRKDLNARDLSVMGELIKRCAELHAHHILQNGDPFEKGSSRPLDFGHWAAHKLEGLTDFRLRHGEAVAIGLALDNVYAMKKGMLAQREGELILDCLQGLGFELFHPALMKANKINPELLGGLEEFREHLGGKLAIMLIRAIGSPCEVHEMDSQLIEESVFYLKERFG